MSNIKFNGNSITFTGLSELDVITQIQRRSLGKRQFTAMGQEDGSTHLTFPMIKAELLEFAGHIHRHNAEVKASVSETEDKPPTPPTTGGTPSAGKVVKLVNTVAIAA
jgi:hypothetical protein